jgi:hypothetical protein
MSVAAGKSVILEHDVGSMGNQILTFRGNIKVKCTLVQALRLCTGRTAHRRSRGIALLFHDQRH